MRSHGFKFLHAKRRLANTEVGSRLSSLIELISDADYDGIPLAPLMSRARHATHCGADTPTILTIGDEPPAQTAPRHKTVSIDFTA